MILLSLLSLFYCSMIAQENPDWRSDGADLMAAGKFDEMLILANELIETRGDSAGFYHLKGTALANLGDFDGSIVAVSKGLEIDPTSPRCLILMSELTMQLGDMNRAEDYAEKAKSADPSSAHAALVLGQIKSYQGNFLAIMELDRAIKLEPEFVEAYLARATHHLSNGAAALAIKDIDHCLNIDPEYIPALYFKVRLMAESGNMEEALAAIDSCLALDEENAEYHATKGTILFFLGRHAEGEQSDSRSIELDDSDFLIYQNRSRNRYKLEDMDGCCEDWNKAIELLEIQGDDSVRIAGLRAEMAHLCDPQISAYYYQRGIAQYNLGDFESSVNMYDEGIKKFPNSQMLYAFKGNAHLQLEDYKLANEAYHMAHENRTTLDLEFDQNPGFNVPGMSREDIKRASIGENAGNIAMTYSELGKHKKAIEHIDYAVLTIDSIQGKVDESILMGTLIARIEILSAAGEHKTAVMRADELISLMPSEPGLYLIKATTLLTSVEQPEKREIWIRHSGADLIAGPKVNVWTKSKVDTATLNRALTACNQSIAYAPNLPDGYFIRAQIKMMLDDPSYCGDVLQCKSLGVDNVEEVLGVTCE